MAQKYVTIQVKEEVRDRLVAAAELLNSKGTKPVVTVAGLVSRIAEAYADQMSVQTIAGNVEDWISDGMPVILDSDGAKHYKELKAYEPVDCSVIVSNFIRNEAMTRRFNAAKRNK